MKSTKSTLVIFFLTAFLIIVGWNSASAKSTNSQMQVSILYVMPGAEGTACSSWTDPCELQTAISLAQESDQIWVAVGTYKPTADTDRTATFQLKSGVAIYGGFPADGGGWDTRDWETNLTTLSGDIGTEADTSDNSYHVVTGSGVDSTAVLDGFTISLGNANGTSPNGDGGGMLNSGGSPTITNVTFSGNSAIVYGGGMYNENSSSPSLTDVTFRGNSATYSGGGMFNYSSSPSLTVVTFDGNTAGEGGGMYNLESIPTLSSVTFSDNSAGSGGGGMVNDFSSPSLTDVTFDSNSAINGGGMYNSESSPSLTDVTFSSNSATDFGGGMWNDYSGPSLTNVTFSENAASGSGGGMSNKWSAPSLTNVTFSGNTATNSGGGMFNYDNFSTSLTNSILWGNTPDQVYGDAMSATYSDIQGGYSGTGNIDENPLLGSLADNGGFTQTHAIAAGSPAIDAGDPAVCPDFDQRGVARPIDGDGDGTAVCDMGAYEYDETQSVILYVKPGADGDCLSWDTACELQAALFDAIEGDQIWVAAGTYKPTADTDRTATFQLKSGVAIYGGFPADGGGWDTRDWETNITTLSGDIGTELDNSDNSYHVITGYEVDSTAILDGFVISGGFANGDHEDSNDVGGGMYNFSGSSPTLNNIIFSDNIATSDGGGLYNYYESNPSLNNVTFTGNTATGDDGNGGGMYNWYGNPTLTNVTFSSNSAVTGGGMENYLSWSPTLTLINVTFSGNTASNGGAGMVNAWSNPSLTNVTFSGNSSVNRGGGMLNYESSPSLANVAFIDNHAANGGGMSNLESDPSLTDVTFNSNTATDSGGGMYNIGNSSPTLTNVTFSGNTANIGGGMYIFDDSSVSLSNVIFNNNFALDNGGGIYNSGISPTLTNVTFNNNTAQLGYGGGIYNYQSNPTLSNVTFSSNSSPIGGGMYNNDNSSPILSDITFNGNSAIYGGGMCNDFNSNPALTNVTFSSNTATDYGGGIFNGSSNPTLTNVTIFGNSAALGGGIHNYNDVGEPSNPTITSTIIWGNVGGQIANYNTSQATVSYSDIEGGYTGMGNINEDPLLDPLAYNGGFTQTLALRMGSPAIDAGDLNNRPATDQRGFFRPVDGDGDGVAVCDMGAYEYGSTGPGLSLFLPLILK